MNKTLFHSVSRLAVWMVSQMHAAMDSIPTAMKMFNITGEVSSMVMACVLLPIKARMNTMLLPRNKSRPRRGSAKATVNSMPIAMTSKVW